MKKFDIWIEGYCATGESATAQCLGKGVEGKDFLDACKTHLEHQLKINDRGEPNIWGCRLFDNEQDARKRYG